jgi:hypothetical protein
VSWPKVLVARSRRRYRPTIPRMESGADFRIIQEALIQEAPTAEGLVRDIGGRCKNPVS